MGMGNEFNFRQKPRGLFKWLLHAPVWIFRARLGFLLGRRIVMLEHRGRKSGRLRRTPLETVHRQGDTYVLCSGTGRKADWYRNLQAHPAEALWVGAKRFPVAQRFLDDTEAAAAFATYEAAHPKAAGRLTEMMRVSYDGADAGRVAMVAQIPVVELTLQR